MEMKKFQKAVIDDLHRYLELIIETHNMADAYRKVWEEKGIRVGFGALPHYNNLIKGTPHICIKVPTGGGKTFIAANSIKPIFDSMPNMQSKVVVWLVPSDAILSQTLKALTNPLHPYRQKIDVDFGNRVEVYSKTQLLNGQNFNPTTVSEQLSILVLSYDSFRTNNKDGRKAFQENGNLATFTKSIINNDSLLEGTDETALIQVVRSLNPVIVVDESHHATSELSVRMLEYFNPSFILDLTATPKNASNLISIVDAIQLKKEQMVKLPVIVYNRNSQLDVFIDAISIRSKLEFQALKDEKESGKYIRPIVLFQAQPKNSDDSATYEKIKKILIDTGVPDEQIAIKTANTDDLKNVDLLSRTCEIRYIITVNALKEGWDCPFAYILATVANKNSLIDVEQILGRVLRLPYTSLNKSEVLNLSYVITSSSDFYKTLDKIVEGLNFSGFSNKDYRISTPGMPISSENEQEQIKINENENEEDNEDPIKIDEIPVIKENYEVLLDELNSIDPDSIIETDELLKDAVELSKEYESGLNNSKYDYEDIPNEVRDKLNIFRIKDEYEVDVSKLLFPQFMISTGPSFFSENEYTLLHFEHLTQGFSLIDKDIQIDFSSVPAELARIDIDDSPDTRPKAWKITGYDNLYFKEWFDSQPSDSKLVMCKQLIHKKLSVHNSVNDRELWGYVDRIIDTLTNEQIKEIEHSPYPYIYKIQEKLRSLLAKHAASTFDRWLEQDIITCRINYKLPMVISPTTFTTSIPKSLYVAEEDMNDYERKVVWELSSLNNIEWWHRNIARKGFVINGHINSYPDIIAKTKSNKILLIETKGDYLDNDESKEKAKIGSKWNTLTERDFRYFMVFEKKNPDYPGAFSYDSFMEIVKEL